MSSRNDLNARDDTGAMLVPPELEVRDNLGALAVQVLSARKNLADLPYETMLTELYTIVKELHSAYDNCWTRLR